VINKKQLFVRAGSLSEMLVLPALGADDFTVLTTVPYSLDIISAGAEPPLGAAFALLFTDETRSFAKTGSGHT
jgi:hypothetical protein